MRFRRIAVSGAIAAVMAVPIASPAFGSTQVADNDTDQSSDFGGQTGVIASNPDQTMVVDNSDSGDTNITQGPRDVTASTGNDYDGGNGPVHQTGLVNANAPIDADVDAPVAVGVGPVLSPNVVVSQNDILSNNGNSYSQEQTTENTIVQTQEDNSTRRNETTQVQRGDTSSLIVGGDFVGRDVITGGGTSVIHRVFGPVTGESVVLTRALSPARTVLLSGGGVKSSGGVTFYDKAGGALPLTGPEHTFPILFTGLSLVLLGCLLVTAGNRKVQGIKPPKISLGERMRFQATRALAFATLMTPIR